jgi:manganese transport protein
VLSFGIPFALVPLIKLTSDRTLMGSDANHRVTTTLGWLVTAVIITLNIALMYLTFAG